ncbi:nucleoside triphosphate pyrophosphohydrolase [Porphyromonas pogonae]|uniref:nucleoside triphosphate pyrophosphohydrolase n=1 Tax=Porphyromonas pogonae TaxID=867595 RepID=UPI002E79F639|nr:nucleoside triphosphate pyrophosphohydrolase [Porphyromonas pogonae]
MHTREEKLEAFGRLLDVMDRLRAECPWDKKQTNESLRANTIEEVYELSDALLADEPEEIKKELGDVLLHVVFYSKIGEEKGLFDIASVANALCDKLIFRHPHIYGEVSVDGSDEVERNWEQLKLREKNGNKTVLGGVPAALPSIVKAHRIQDKARGVGFDWSDRAEVWNKVDEELGELKEAIQSQDEDGIESEFGDFLFSIINASRLYKVNPDNALEKTNRKFIRRFGYVEQQAKAHGKALKEMTLEEMDHYWNEAKQQETDR